MGDRPCIECFGVCEVNESFATAGGVQKNMIEELIRGAGEPCGVVECVLGIGAQSSHVCLESMEPCARIVIGDKQALIVHFSCDMTRFTAGCCTDI